MRSKNVLDFLRQQVTLYRYSTTGDNMNKTLSKLGRFSWTLHNVVAHPLSEILYQLGYENLGNKIHDKTIPQHIKGEGRG